MFIINYLYGNPLTTSVTEVAVATPSLISPSSYRCSDSSCNLSALKFLCKSHLHVDIYNELPYSLNQFEIICFLQQKLPV